MALAMEDYDSRFLEAHGMDKGNLYKLKDGETRAYEEERYQAPDAVSHGEDYTNIVANLHHTKSEAWLKTYVDYDQWYLYETVQQAVRHYDLGTYPEQEDRIAPVDTDAGKNLAWYFKPDRGKRPMGSSGTFPGIPSRPGEPTAPTRGGTWPWWR